MTSFPCRYNTDLNTGVERPLRCGDGEGEGEASLDGCHFDTASDGSRARESAYSTSSIRFMTVFAKLSSTLE